MKTEMKAFLKQNKSSQFGTSFEFNLHGTQVVDNQFSWEEEGSEFRYQGEMYDVVSIEKKQDKLVVVCLKDNNENQLEKQLNEIRKSNKSSNPKTALHNIKFFSVFYQSKPELSYDINNPTTLRYPTEDFRLSSILFDITLPPPRC